MKLPSSPRPRGARGPLALLGCLLFAAPSSIAGPSARPKAGSSPNAHAHSNLRVSGSSNGASSLAPNSTPGADANAQAEANAIARRSASPTGGLRGGGTRPTPAAHDCLSDVDRARVAKLLAEYEAQHAPAAGGPATLGAPLGPLTAYPQAGRWYRDLFTGNYSDLDPSGGTLDWDCGDWTYDGHDATDTGLRTFDEQLIGVPVVAAWDGVVAATHDGEPDMNTVPMGQPANFVILDHGAGRTTRYWHLKNGSVAVAVGQIVRAGEPLGLTASSGNSTGPHLHFSIYDNGQRIEPHGGPCQPAPSEWEQQRPKPHHPYLLDFAVTRTDLAGWDPVFGMPRDNQIALSDNLFRMWAFVPALSPNSQWAVLFRDPADQLVFDSGAQSFNNPSEYRWSWWWWSYDIPAMHTTPGTWTVELWINGRRMVAAPYEVVATIDPQLNRAPEAVEVGFFPPNPGPDDVVHAEIQSHLSLDDPDFDLLGYHYVWRVNGSVVRDVTTAAHSDVLAAGSVSFGDQLECSVTPNDGSLDGPTTPAAVTIDCWAPFEVRVDARSNLFAAGHASPDAPSGGGLGLLPIEIPLDGVGGQVVRFPSVSGLVSPGPAGQNDADGGVLYGGSTDVASADGIAGLIHPSRTMFLAGVFVGPDEPVAPAPPRLDVSTQANATDIAPDLHQTFFIGDGLTGTGSGALQRFYTPSGATRLCLGFVDGNAFQIAPGWYDDNAGALTVEVDLPPPGDCGCRAEVYCVAGPNSTGQPAAIGSIGDPRIAMNDFRLRCTNLPSGQPGLFYYGTSQTQQTFGNGTRCVGGTTIRLPIQSIDGSGAAERWLDFQNPVQPSGAIEAGSSWFFQFWYRDPAAGGAAFDLSEGLAVTFCP